MNKKKQFSEFLANHPSIESVIEIGLNTGHSAENFFQSCPNLKQFVSFDINGHWYTKHAIEYFRRNYKNRFLFVEGDSASTVPNYAKEFPDQKFDLVYVDGYHTYEYCYQDILNCKKLAHPNTVLWVDDCAGLEVEAALQNLVEEGVIIIHAIHESSEHYGSRSWIDASYVFE